MGIGPAMPKLVVGIQPKHVAVGSRSVRPAPPNPTRFIRTGSSRRREDMDGTGVEVPSA